jgi:hypothetical protein
MYLRRLLGEEAVKFKGIELAAYAVKSARVYSPLLAGVSTGKLICRPLYTTLTK